MRTMLLAAGLGTRLRPLTDSIPKCLVPIREGGLYSSSSDFSPSEEDIGCSLRGKPLLQIWLERLSTVGFGPFLVNTHYLADQVEYFIAHGSFYNQVTLVHEPNLLGTAGTLLSNMAFFSGKDGLVIHADNYCTADFKAFYNAHITRPSHCLMTMMTFRTETPQTCGILELDEQGVVLKMHEKVSNPPGNLANGAIYIISPEMQSELKSSLPNVSDISTEVIPQFMGRIYTYEANGIFTDIGTFEAYDRLNRMMNSQHQSVVGKR